MTKPRLFINGYGVADVAYDPVDSVSVNVTTSMTYGQVLTALYNLIDWDKVSENPKIVLLGSHYYVTQKSGTLMRFYSFNYSGLYEIEISSSPKARDISLSGSITDQTNSYAWTDGVCTLYY